MRDAVLILIGIVAGRVAPPLYFKVREIIKDGTLRCKVPFSHTYKFSHSVGYGDYVKCTHCGKLSFISCGPR